MIRNASFVVSVSLNVFCSELISVSKNLAGWARKVTEEAEMILKYNTFGNATLKNNCFLGFIVSRIIEARQSLKYLPHSFIHSFI